MADTMIQDWVSFARDGDPNVEGLPGWPAYDPASRVVLEFGEPIGSTVASSDAVVRFCDERLER